MRFGRLLFAFVAVMVFVFPVLADSFPTQLDVTAVTDVSQCQVPLHFLKFTCIPISLSLQIAVQPFGFADWLQVTNVTGTMDGVFPISNGADDFLEPEQNYVPGFGPNGPLFFKALGDTWIINLDQMDPDVYVMDETTGFASWITWDATPVSAPEPSSLALLAIGLTGIIGYGKRRIRQV
jgi:PEP-CTERM motif